MLVTQPQCTDKAIAALQTFARADAAALSDLAGAYYVRAQRKDDPADLLRAFDWARKAVALKPRPRGAQFNYALILEALSLNAEAIEAWQRAAAVEDGDWAKEAQEHYAALVQRTSLDSEQQWTRVRAAIDAALDGSGDLGDLVSRFPASSQKHFEEKVLPEWANAPSLPRVVRVARFAAELSQFFRDPYFKDVAARIVNAPSDALRQGHLRFAEARDAESAMDFPRAAPLYAAAARLLEQAGSPQSLLAHIAHAGQSPLITNDYNAASKELDAVEANGRRYPSVMTRVALNRINTDQFLNRYADLLKVYDAVMAWYGGIGDWEDRAAASARAIAAMSVVGLKARAWRETFVAIRDLPRLRPGKTRHLLIGATETAALDLDHPEAALLYQTVGVDTAGGAPARASALGHLAAIELRLQRYDAAQRHVDEAMRLNAKFGDPLRRVLQARLAQVQGETALHSDAAKAVAALTQAIDTAKDTEFTTFRAMLFAQRADAFHRLGQTAKEKDDRREAMNQLHAEEESMLGERKPGRLDDLWNSYFSRFEDTYDLLIRQLLDEGNIEEPFRYAERARAYEPLDLVRKLPAAPAAFRELAAHADNVDIAKLRASLPPATFVIEYSVFDDRTFAWIVGRDLFDGKWVTARRSDVKRWTDALQDAASRKDSAAFEASLEPAYDALLRVPLDVIRRAPGGASANIVIVPDRKLRGLPFAALRNPDTKRYVIEDHALSSSGSALLYVFAVDRDRELPRRDASALLIGNPAFDPKSPLAEGLGPLPFAQNEVEEIRRNYPHPEVLIGDAATPEQFFRLAGRSAIVHIAAHGVVNGSAPSQSYLLFHGVLTAERLLNELHTNKTRLVVLGACSSAGGLPVGAEGIAPLVRPIVAANVPGVVGALWDIDDATAAALLVSFHRHYRRGKDAAAALRDAQLDMLRGDLKSGRFWAPFQVIGYASSPFPSMGDITKEKPP
jgi:CHAT domain-containing protein